MRTVARSQDSKEADRGIDDVQSADTHAGRISTAMKVMDYPGAEPDQSTRSIRVLPSVLGLTRSRSRNSATPSSYERSSSA